MIKSSTLTLFACFMLFLMSCEKDDPVIPNEEEVITTLTYTLTPAGGGTPVVLTFQDLDGDGGGAPTITDDAILQANSTYNGSVGLLNEAEDPAEDIGLEVLEESLEHQFFFQSSIQGLTIVYADVDELGMNPLGLESTLTTGGVGSGSITITLKHEPLKDAPGVSDGDISEAGGETDIAVTFPIDVQ